MKNKSAKDNNQNKDNLELFDVHSHIIPGVDDGCETIDEALLMLREEEKNKVRNIILTPHYRKGMFEVHHDEVEKKFYELKKEIEKNDLNINLYLGREIYINSLTGSFERMLERIDQGIIKGLNNTKNYLIEFSYTKEIEISEITYSMINKGFKPIVAHVERYAYVHTLEKVNEIRQTGALIQVNASSVVGLDGLKSKMFVWKLLKNNLVDLVASDIHLTRKNCLLKAYKLIENKISKETADKLFVTNPASLLN